MIVVVTTVTVKIQKGHRFGENFCKMEFRSWDRREKIVGPDANLYNIRCYSQKTKSRRNFLPRCDSLRDEHEIFKTRGANR
jgi:hypothetical protein